MFTGDELFTDASKIKVVDDCIYEVTCRYITRKEGDIELAGANPSAEGEDLDEGSDATVVSGLDVVLNQRLVETGFSKSDYKNYLKTYTKSLVDKWKELEWSEAKIADAKTKFTEAAKRMLKKVDDAKFFLGESSNPDGMVALLEYREEEGGDETPLLLFFKHGVDEEKV